jgi:hypothetical protein
MICPERERLQHVYLEAAAKIADAGARVPDMTSAKWKEATGGARLGFGSSPKGSHSHRKDHGC